MFFWKKRLREPCRSLGLWLLGYYNKDGSENMGFLETKAISEANSYMEELFDKMKYADIMEFAIYNAEKALEDREYDLLADALIASRDILDVDSDTETMNSCRDNELMLAHYLEIYVAEMRKILEEIKRMQENGSWRYEIGEYLRCRSHAPNQGTLTAYEIEELL